MRARDKPSVLGRRRIREIRIPRRETSLRLPAITSRTPVTRAIPTTRFRTPARSAPRDQIPNARENVRDPRSRPRSARCRARSGPRARDVDRSRVDANRDAREAPRDDGERRSTRDLGLSFGRVTDRGLAVNESAKSSLLYPPGCAAATTSSRSTAMARTGRRRFDRYVYNVDTGERIKVVVFRDGREEVVYLEPTIFYADASYDEDIADFGVVFDTRYPDRLIVRRIYADSPALVAGLRIGDEIVSWHGQPVHNVQEFGKLIDGANAAAVDFQYARGSQTMRGEAKLDQRVATKPSTGTEPVRDTRNPPANPGPGQLPPPGPMPNPAPGRARTRPRPQGNPLARRRPRIRKGQPLPRQASHR